MTEAPGFDRFGRFVNRRALGALQPELRPGERVLYATEAHRERAGVLAATDRRILFVWAGWWRRHVAAWTYAELRAVRVRRDVDDAVVTLTTQAGEVPFAHVRKANADAFAQAVKTRPPAPGEPVRFQDQRKRPRTVQEQRLERLDRLLERGAMTRAEHERARRAVLDEDT